MASVLVTNMPSLVEVDCGSDGVKHVEQRHLVKVIPGTKKTSCRRCYEDMERREYRRYAAMVAGGKNGKD